MSQRSRRRARSWNQHRGNLGSLRPLRVLAIVAVAVLAAAACGKKGPPLPPIVHIPAAVEHISARRVGNDVFITLTVPAENIDKTMPADVGRIEVYGFTGTTQPPRGRFLDVATLVGTIEVPPPEIEPGTAKPSKTPRPATPAPAPSGSPASSQSAGRTPEAPQGAMVTVHERLSADALVARAVPAPAQISRRAPPPPASATAKEAALRRFYIAVPFSPRGRPGPPGATAELMLTAIPEAPLGVVASMTSDEISVSWEPLGGLIGYLLEHPLSIESSPVDEPAAPAVAAPAAPAVAAPEPAAHPALAEAPPGPTSYNVYREIEPAPGAATEAASDTPSIAPINAAPLSVLTFSEPLPLLDGRKRCYTVRAVRGTGATAIEGEASAPACVTPTDDFPPAAPTGVSATSEPGAISLSWEPNTEADLAGYVVLRGEAGDATLTPLTGTVTTDPRFVDRTVKPGVRYIYAVTAVDTHLPTPNVSAESARVEETAR